MEGYMFLDASSLYPFLQWLRNPSSVLQPCKHKKLFVFGTSTTHGIRLVGDWKISTHLCIYLWDVYAPTAIACLWYLLPLQVLDSIWRKPVKIEKKEARLSTSLSQGVSANRFTSSRVSDARSLSSDGMPFTLALTSTVRYSSMKACFTPALTYSIVVWRWFGLQTQPNGLACCLLSYTLGTTRWKDTTRCHGERTCAASRSPWCSIMLSSYSVYSTSDLYKLSISSFGTYT